MIFLAYLNIDRDQQSENVSGRRCLLGKRYTWRLLFLKNCDFSDEKIDAILFKILLNGSQDLVEGARNNHEIEIFSVFASSVFFQKHEAQGSHFSCSRSCSVYSMIILLENFQIFWQKKRMIVRRAHGEKKGVKPH